MRKVRSIKGQIVDFDLIKIKQQIAAQPAPVNVREREDFIDKKVRRRSKKNKTPESKLDITVEPAFTEEEMVEEQNIDKEPVTTEVEQSEPTPSTPRPARRRGKNE